MVALERECERVASTTRRLMAGIDPHQVDICARVLDEVRANAERQLSAAHP